jgi:hypothetical protein
MPEPSAEEEVFLDIEIVVPPEVSDEQVDAAIDRAIGRVAQRAYELSQSYCVLPGTFVLVNPTPKKVEELTGGERLVSKENVLSKTVQYYEGPVVRVQAHNLQFGVYLTPEHLVLTRKSPLKTHSHLFRRLPEWVPAGNLTKEHFIGVPIYKFYNEKVSEDLAELFGWYVAEGWSSDPGGVGFAFGPHEMGVAERIRTLLYKFGAKTTRLREFDRSSGHFIGLWARSKDLAQLLSENCGRRAREKKVPEIIMKSTPESVSKFLEHYARGDGWVTEKFWVLSTVSPTLAFQLFQLATGFGVLPCIMMSNPTGFGTKNGLPTWTIKWVSLDKDTTYKYIVGEQYIWTRIFKVSVEKYSGLVYDLSTESEQYYVPFVVHNCPVRTGNLKRSGKFEVYSDGFRLWYETPYTGVIEKGRPKTPITGEQTIYVGEHERMTPGGYTIKVPAHYKTYVNCRVVPIQTKDGGLIFRVISEWPEIKGVGFMRRAIEEALAEFDDIVNEELEAVLPSGYIVEEE